MNIGYMEVLGVYVRVIDKLMMKNSASNMRLCMRTKSGRYGNFRVSTFKTILAEEGAEVLYRDYMRIFRTFEWIICQPEKFSNIQKINGKSIRVITVDLEKYKLIKELLGE